MKFLYRAYVEVQAQVSLERLQVKDLLIQESAKCYAKLDVKLQLSQRNNQVRLLLNTWFRQKLGKKSLF